MRLVERAGQIHPRIGQLESFAMPYFRGRKRKPVDAADLQSLHRHQVLRIQLMRNVKQNIVPMFRAPGRR